MSYTEIVVEIDRRIAKCEAEVGALRSVRELLVNGTAHGKANPTANEESRIQKPRAQKSPGARRSYDECCRLLAQHISINGPIRQSQIIAQFGFSGSIVAKMGASDYFERDTDGWHLTATGRQLLNKRDEDD